MDLLDKVLLEWSSRTEKGYPDLNNEQDLAIFESMFGFSLQEEEKTDNTSEISQDEVNKIVDAFNQIKEPYSKYLSIFNYFDPNSLGTISEVLLTQLLNTVEGVKADHVGGGQGLADLIINGNPISLKTTASTKAIGLGSDEVTTSPSDAKEVVKVLQKVYNDTPEAINHSVRELEKIVDSQTYQLILNRIKAIAKKLTGDENKEFFVWVEKLIKNGIMTGIVIHTVKYDYNNVYNELLDNRFYLTKKAWGVVDKDTNKQLISPDTSGKLLNIQPSFVRKTSKDKTVSINLVTNFKKRPEEIKDELPKKFFDSLDKIYSDLFQSK